MTDQAPTPRDTDRDLRELDDRIARFARRRARARTRRGKSLWVQASTVGTLGWLLAMPIVLGALLGHLLDLYLGSGITWAMAFMFLGVLVAGYSLWKLTVDTRMEEEREQQEADALAATEAPPTEAPPNQHEASQPNGGPEP